MKIDKQKIREVAREIDMFEMKHYNEDLKGEWEKLENHLHEINDEAFEAINHEYTEMKKSQLQKKFAKGFFDEMMTLQHHIDRLEHIGVQNGLIRSKHLHNLLLAAKNRVYVSNDNVDHVQVTIPWYKVDNLIENLYLKYHTTPIHKASKAVNDYFINPDEDHMGIYCYWKEQPEIFFEEEETTSNHYHDSDYEWEYDVDPKECKNLRDFFKKRFEAKKEINKQKEIELMRKVEAENQRKKEIAVLNAQNHKLRNYVPVVEYNKEIIGSVYWFVDVNKTFAKNKHGVLYVGESTNFNTRYKSYEPKTDKLTELEQKLKKRFPEKTEDQIKKFARDPKKCRLRVITKKMFNDRCKRKGWEARVMRRVKPILNKSGAWA